MAEKSKKQAPKSKKAANETAPRVTKITASSTPTKGKKAKAKKAIEAEVVNKKAPNASRPMKKNILTAIGGYFKGAWVELKQVRWPTRRATWELTLAVIIFTIFFVALIILFDLGFQRLFELIIN